HLDSTLFPYTTLFRSSVIFALKTTMVNSNKAISAEIGGYLGGKAAENAGMGVAGQALGGLTGGEAGGAVGYVAGQWIGGAIGMADRKSTRLNSSHVKI